MDLQVIDNFLSPYHLEQLQFAMMGPEFPWCYRDGLFTHTFLDLDSDGGFVVDGDDHFLRSAFNVALDGSAWFISPFLRLGEMHRINAKLTPKTLFNRKSDYTCLHNPEITSAIFYINTNNGWTQFKKSGKKIKSVENRMVIFDSELEYRGFTCTDKKIRVSLKFDYVKP